MLQQVALLSQTASVPLNEVAKVSAAIQKQVSRDFGPIWSINATVDAFATLNDVPAGYWPVVVRSDVAAKQHAAGVHLDDTGQPFALVQSSKDWSLTASHETLEMLVDPFGGRLVAGPAPKEAKGQKRVEFLVEVCDPSEASSFAYTVNDVLVSDFYTPHYLEPITSSAVRYCYGGAIKAPRTILKGGYLSWHNPVNNHWYQIRWFSGSKPALADLGVFTASSMSTREWIDGNTQTPRMIEEAKVKVTDQPLFFSVAPESGAGAASDGRAAMVQAQIDGLVAGG